MTALPTTSNVLSPAQERVLYQLAGHKYGWGYILGIGPLSAARTLVRRGLLEELAGGRFVLASEGDAEVGRRWPNSPCILNTYVPPDDGWDRMDG